MSRYRKVTTWIPPERPATVRQPRKSALKSLGLFTLCVIGVCLVGVAGTASARDDQGLIEKGKMPGPRSLFVVFDVSLERDALKGADANAPAQSVLQRSIAGLVPLLRAWGERNGVQVEAALFADRKRIDLEQRTFSHLIVEKIIQEARVDGVGGATFSSRKWAAQAFDLRDGPSKSPVKLGAQEFISDGIACFDAMRVPIDTNCQRDYLRALSKHLQWIDPAWSEIDVGS